MEKVIGRRADRQINWKTSDVAGVDKGGSLLHKIIEKGLNQDEKETEREKEEKEREEKENIEEN